MSVANLSGLAQESLVTLLCYDAGPKGARFVRVLTPPATFDIYWREIAQAASDYLDRYGAPPCDHTADIIESLCAKAPKKATVYRDLFDSMKLSKESINADYVLDQARAFASWQRMNAGITSALDGLQKETAEGVTEAEQAFSKALKETGDLFDPGTYLDDPDRALRFLTTVQEDSFPTGIGELDRMGVCPGRGKLFLGAGEMKFGKSTMLRLLAKASIFSGHSVLYVTLEMGEDETTGEVFRTFFSIASRPLEKFTRPKFAKDERGVFVDFEQIPVGRRPVLTDSDIAAVLRRKQKVLKRRPKMLIKEFATDDLTLRGLEGYLDGVEGSGFRLDHLIVDYADLMQLDPKNLRTSTQAIYRGLRRLAKKRNIAVSTVSQTNRADLGTGKQDKGNLAEDIGKAAICDYLVIGSRTDEEKELGLARLLVAAARGAADRRTIIVARHDELGQFALDSAFMGKRENYRDRVSGRTEEDED